MENNYSISHFLRNVCSYCVLILVILSIFVYLTWNIIRPYRDEYESVDTTWNNLNGYKIIFAHNVPEWFSVRDGVDVFNNLKCSYNKCRWTTKIAEKETSDLVLFINKYVPPIKPRRLSQIYALFLSESPPHTSPLPNTDAINWTITYRYDSTIPAPYRRWVPFKSENKQQLQNINYAENKTKTIAWFVSNCNDKNGRLRYARELQKYIQVDIYGKCGSLSCARDNPEICHDMLERDYKFYLAFENSNCKNYITEKLFDHSLSRTILPIVMGAPRIDYEKYAPHRSFIHVDEFDSPAELAQYLHVLDKNDELYNSYFQWKGSGQIIADGGQFICELCAKLHDDRFMSIPSWYENINHWWNEPGICSNGTANSTNILSQWLFYFLVFFHIIVRIN